MITGNADSESPRTTTVLAVVWVVSIQFAFASCTLPNNRQITRGDVWSVVPFRLLDLVDPPPPEPGQLPSGLGYLPQRFDLFLVAAVVLLGARAIGSLLMRLRVLGRWDALEREVFAWGLGLSAWSLLVLGLGLVGLLSKPLFVAVLVLAIVGDAVWWWRMRSPTSERPPSDEEPRSPLPWLVGALVLPFVVAILLGSVLPPTDYDAKGYHLLGPKEFHAAGRIGFLPHNVYTSFPFLTEMLTLSGMVVHGDWFRGALAGKCVLAAFGPLTAFALFVAARRWFGPAAGWMALLVSLTTPWTYRISTIAYAEGGLAFYLFVTTFAALLAAEALLSGDSDRDPLGPSLLAGAMAGSAMACKYPALITVVFPLGPALVLSAWLATRRRTKDEEAESFATRHPVLGVAGAFAVGCAVTIGPWLLKNVVETGNPVYPLAYSVFGGRDLSPELAAKWVAGHSPDDHDVTRLPGMLVDVTLRNDWLSPLLYGLAPLALLVLMRRSDEGEGDARGRRIVAALWCYVAYLFVVWWFFTHRIDRFWVPMLPVVSLLAGVGVTRLEGRAWQAVMGVVVLAATAFNLVVVTSGLSGNNTFLVDLDASREQVASTAPPVAAANELLPEGARVLCVGEAQMFDATFENVYNTVFDECLFEAWFARRERGTPPAEWSLRPTDEIRERLRSEGITHVLVSWAEVDRYRRTYGFTKFVTPTRFTALREAGILGEPIDAPGARAIEPAEAERLRTWARELLVRFDPDTGRVLGDADETTAGVLAFGPTWQLYPVLRE